MFVDAPLTIERLEGKAPETRIFRLSGPLTLRNLFEFQAELRAGAPPRLTILELSGVPYMDSAGMGAVINYYVHCEKNGARMIAAGVGSRVLELFKLTRVDTVIPLAASLEEAESRIVPARP